MAYYQGFVHDFFMIDLGLFYVSIIHDGLDDMQLLAIKTRITSRSICSLALLLNALK